MFERNDVRDAMVSMAGRLAEEVILGITATGCEADDANIATVLDATGQHRHARDLANYVRTLIRFNRARVQQIARYLIARGELAGNQIGHLV